MFASIKLLILPNVAVLSDEQCDQLRAYSSQQGGSLLATYETSLYDEVGDQRQDFGLADLFGVHFKRQLPGPMKNSYLRLEKTPATASRSPDSGQVRRDRTDHQRPVLARSGSRRARSALHP